MPIHSCTLPSGGSGFKWGNRGTCYADRKDAERQAEAAYANGYTGDEDIIAMDRESVRERSADGFLHIKVAHISKATVNPYWGREIPDYETLGLDPDKIYQVWRPPSELEKAAPTFNNLPLLKEHIAVTAELPNRDAWVGSTGTDAVFNDPYLDNSLVIWDGDAADQTEENPPSGKVKRQLSCAYRYRAIVENGVTTNGIAYDLKMADIVGNHVALVEAGRAGPDVIIGDVMPKIALKSKKAVLVSGALRGVTAGLLAADAAIDLNPILSDVNRRNYLAKKPVITTRLLAAMDGKLASGVTIADVKAQIPVWLGALDAEEMDGEDEMEKAEDKAAMDARRAKDEEEDEEEEERERVEDRKRARDRKRAKDARARDRRARDGEPETEEEKAKREKAEKAEDDEIDGMDRAMDKRFGKDRAKDRHARDRRAKDEPPEFKGEPKTGASDGMTIADFQAIRQAERDVQPYVGNVNLTMDSAADIYKFALETIGVDVSGVHPSAFPALLKMAPKPGASKQMANDNAAPLTLDAKVSERRSEMFGESA